MLKLDTQFPLINNQINHLVFFQENNALYSHNLLYNSKYKGPYIQPIFFRCGFFNFRKAPNTLVL